MIASSSFEETEVVGEWPVLFKDPISEIQIMQYAEASGDFNPIHLDPEAGAAAGVGGRIAHGMLIMGFCGQAITRRIPKRALKKFSVRFSGMARPGDRIAIRCRVREIVRNEESVCLFGEITAISGNGEAVATGTFEARCPIRSQRNGQRSHE